jgi:hypothetical protein
MMKMKALTIISPQKRKLNASRKEVINQIFRHISLFNSDSPTLKILGTNDYKFISELADTAVEETKDIIERFIQEYANYSQFWREAPPKWEHRSDRLRTKVRIYLHKTHKIAPVFSYPRAVRNLEILHQKLQNIYFWPKISVQLAILIWITEKNDPSQIYERGLIQKNIRNLLSVSAYAFHRTRNKLKIPR